MSPHSRRGRGASSKHQHGRPDQGQASNRAPQRPPQAAPQPPVQEPVDEPVEEEQPETIPAASRSRADVQSRAEARRAARTMPAEARRKRQHGMAYRWISAYLPLLVVLFGLLGALWVYTTYLKPPTLAQQWQTVEQKWLPEREKARDAVLTAAKASPFDLAAYQTAVRSYADQIKGWNDAVQAVKDWGDAKDDVKALDTTAQGLLTSLKGVDSAKTAYDVLALQDQISQDDSSFTEDVLLIRKDLSLATPVASPSPLAFPSVSPTASPGESASPTASATPAPSTSPTASATAAP